MQAKNFVLATSFLLLLAVFAVAPWTSIGGLKLTVESACANGNAYVTVSNSEGDPVSGAIVTVAKEDRVTEGQTGASGKLTLALQEAGSYEFRARTTVAGSPPLAVEVKSCGAQQTTEPTGTSENTVVDTGPVETVDTTPVDTGTGTTTETEATASGTVNAEATGSTAAATGLFGLAQASSLTGTLEIMLIVLVVVLVAYFLYTRMQ